MKKNNISIILMNLVSWVAPMILISIIAGCATPPPNPVLVKAQSSYQSAKNNPDIEKNAPVALYEAKKSLDKAATAEDVKEIEREANRAERQVQIATALSEERKSEQKIEELTKENETLLLERSRRQADQRAVEANQARQLAEQKVKEAEIAKLESERMKKEADAKAMEAERLRLEAEKAKEELEKLQKDLAELQAQQTDRGLVLTLRDVLFEFGKADLQPGAIRTIQKVAEFLLKNPQRNVLIEGHTDNIGGDEFNLNLSERRADSVRRALIDDEVPRERITIKGYGKRFPVASNDTDSGRQQNRRVEIVILNEGATAESMSR